MRQFLILALKGALFATYIAVPTILIFALSGCQTTDQRELQEIRRTVQIDRSRAIDNARQQALMDSYGHGGSGIISHRHASGKTHQHYVGPDQLQEHLYGR